MNIQGFQNYKKYDMTNEGHVICKIIQVLTHLNSKPEPHQIHFSLEEIKEYLISLDRIKKEDMPTDDLINSALTTLYWNGFVAIMYENFGENIQFSTSLKKN